MPLQSQLMGTSVMASPFRAASYIISVSIWNPCEDRRSLRHASPLMALKPLVQSVILVHLGRHLNPVARGSRNEITAEITKEAKSLLNLLLRRDMATLEPGKALDPITRSGF